MKHSSYETETGPIAWMCSHGVAAKLLLLFLVVGGFFSLYSVRQEFFPTIGQNSVIISVFYPKAAPEEVEQGVVLPIEDALQGMREIKEITNLSFEQQAYIQLSLVMGTDATLFSQEVKSRLDRISTFPEEARAPVVQTTDNDMPLLTLQLWGEQEMTVLKRLAQRMKEDLTHDEGVSLVTIGSVPATEIRVEVSQAELRKHQLSLRRLAGVLKRAALGSPAGDLDTAQGSVLLKVGGDRDVLDEFSSVPILDTGEGGVLSLGEIASIKEVIEEDDFEQTFNGVPTISLYLYQAEGETPKALSNRVKAYVERMQDSFPEGVEIALLNNLSEVLEARVALLTTNACFGLFLVLVLLGLFLDPRLAFWVALGIPVSLLGSFIFFPFFDISINMITLFAFLITLGIIVDDAVVIGEQVYKLREEGVPPLRAAIQGAKEMCVPVAFAVLTNVVAFVPFLFIPGAFGSFWLQIGIVVIVVFSLSLLESLFILPSHLASMKEGKGIWKLLAAPSRFVEKLLNRFVERCFVPFFSLVCRYRYVTLAAGVGAMVILVGAFAGGLVPVRFRSVMEAEEILAQITMPYGIPTESARALRKQLVEAGERVVARHSNEGISRGMYARIGTPFIRRNSWEVGGTHLIGAKMYLTPADERTVSSTALAEEWRHELGEIVGAVSVGFSGIYAGVSDGVEVSLSHSQRDVLALAAEELTGALSQYKGVLSVDSGLSDGKAQLSFRITPEAQAAGLSSHELTQQVGGAFSGCEALRLQREKEEVQVLVCLPRKERRALHSLETMVLQTEAGGELPLAEAATVTRDTSTKSILRMDGRRTLSLFAMTDPHLTSEEAVRRDLSESVLPALTARYPGLHYSFTGAQKEEGEIMFALLRGTLLALLAIYAILSIPFHNFAQPLIVMVSIPFGVIGAVGGHFLLGYQISLMSILGVIALSGVVINDALVLVVAANRRRQEEGESPWDAVLWAGKDRLRPILLTSLTTFFGLVPMIFETSLQARFLVPMAISLGCGILFATFIILLLVPALYLIVEDIGQLRKRRVS